MITLHAQNVIFKYYIQIVSDYMFFKGIDDFVNLLSKFSNQPTYYYFYKHRANFSVLLDWKIPHFGDNITKCTS